MKSLNEYLDIYKEKKGLKSDYELSKSLGITRAAVSIIRSGGGVNRDNAIKISEGAKIKLENIWLASLTQKEQNQIFKKVLENISKKAGTTASILLLVTLIPTGLHMFYENVGNYVFCILCKIREFEY